MLTYRINKHYAQEWTSSSRRTVTSTADAQFLTTSHVHQAIPQRRGHVTTYVTQHCVDEKVRNQCFHRLTRPNLRFHVATHLYFTPHLCQVSRRCRFLLFIPPPSHPGTCIELFDHLDFTSSHDRRLKPACLSSSSSLYILLLHFFNKVNPVYSLS